MTFADYLEEIYSSNRRHANIHHDQVDVVARQERHDVFGMIDLVNMVAPRGKDLTERQTYFAFIIDDHYFERHGMIIYQQSRFRKNESSPHCSSAYGGRRF